MMWADASCSRSVGPYEPQNNPLDSKEVDLLLMDSVINEVCVRYQVLTATSIKMAVFWYVMPLSVKSLHTMIISLIK
jgi:hypothetical protein